ncbi:MAG: hypothetical protein ABJE95_18700 [Byssovorax sp.]
MSPRSWSRAWLSGSARATFGWAALLGVPLAAGCSTILGADLGYYEVGAGGSGATTSASTTSTAAVSSSSSGGSGGGSASSSASSSSASATSATSSAGTGGAVNDTCWHGAPADPGGSDPCGASSVAVLKDNFNDNQISPLWTAYQISATAQEINQRVEVAVPGPINKFAGFVSNNAYSLLNCHASMAVLQSPQHPNTVTHMSMSPDPSIGADLVEVQQTGQSLYFVLRVGGVATDACQIPYLPVAHRYWRIREIGGELLWETGSDGVAWTIQRKETTPGFASSVRVDFGVIPIGNDPAGTGIFDDFDLP